MMKRFSKAFVYAAKGWVHAFRTQPNFRLELIACVCVTAAGFYFGITAVEWICCLFCMGMVLGAELLNTGIEALTDLVSPEHHPLAGKAKDAGAAAVLAVAVCSAVVGCIIFIPYFVAWIYGR